jgi:hypothetical protein
MGQDPLDWEGIKQLFMHSGMSLVRIGATCGVSGCTIGDRAKRDGWVRVAPMVPLPRGRKPRVGPRPTSAESRRRRMLLRLTRAVEHTLDSIEARMSVDAKTPDTPADDERNARTFTTIVRVCEKLKEMEKELEEGSGSTDLRSSADAEQFRRELALRLDRLTRGGDA